MKTSFNNDVLSKIYYNWRLTLYYGLMLLIYGLLLRLRFFGHFSLALHFVLTDRNFCRFYQVRFNHMERFLLIIALLVGWLCSVIFDPVNVLIAAFMVAFLASSVLLNVFREELPASGLASYCWFTFGVLLIMLILLLNT